MKRGFVFLLMILILLANISIISATYKLGNPPYSIEKNYGPGEALRGWINISLTDEPSNSVFENSEGDAATLKELVNADTNFLDACEPLSCSSNYEAGEKITGLTLNKGKSAIFGFKITGDWINGVEEFSIDITSNAPSSDSPQLTMDILNDGEKEWWAHAISGNFKDSVYGCYTSGDELAEIIQTQYCQKITIPSAPNVKIGAKLTGSGTANFIMSIEKTDYSKYGECQISVSGAQIASCEPEDFSAEEGDYFVCIMAKSAEDEGKYRINSETNNPCGFAGFFNDGYERDYEIFAKPGKYGAVGSFTLNDSELSSINSPITDLESYVLDYLYWEYESVCSDGCIAPIKISSEVDNQVITLSNAILTYYDGDTKLTKNELYGLTETPAKINAEMQKLSIDAGNFKVPEEYGNYTISLSFKGEKIFSEEIRVEKVPVIKSLNPLKTAAAHPTTFTAGVTSDKKIKLYEWDFGNGDTNITTTNKVIYTYNATGSYSLKVRAIDTDDMSSSKTFEISVAPASKVTGFFLQEKRTNLEKIKEQIKKFSEFEKEVLNQMLDIETAETQLNSAEAANELASTEEDYQAVLQILIDLEIPKTIFLSSSASSILFYPKKGSINPEIVAEITGEKYDGSKEDKYASAILGWDAKNVYMTMTYKGITAAFENYNEPLLKTFNIEVKKKSENIGNSYIILKKVEGLTFAEVYSEKEKAGYIYFPFTGESKKLSFAITEDVSFSELPFFVSPKISELSLADFDILPVDEYGKLKKWALFGLIVLLLIIIGTIFWIFLQAWYKKKYEDYLFKNKNNLYNLFTWIEGAKKRGLGEKEMRSQLKKAGWGSEQLTYALRKYAGKRTGMPELPIGKITKRIGKESMAQGKLPGNQQQRGKQNFNTRQ